MEVPPLESSTVTFESPPTVPWSSSEILSTAAIAGEGSWGISVTASASVSVIWLSKPGSAAV